jgi:hypothetical protein
VKFVVGEIEPAASHRAKLGGADDELSVKEKVLVRREAEDKV